jgi:hypothetical protein
MRPAAILITLAAVLLLAACGGSSTPASQTAPATSPSTQAAAPATTSPAVTTTSPTASTTTSTASSSPATGSTLCRAAELSGSFLGGQAATGHGLLGFELRNVSSHTCITLGYPGIQFLSRAGQALPTSPTHTTQDFFGSLTNHPLAVAPGTSVSFRLGVTHGAASPASCTMAFGLQVIPPNDTATLRIGIPGGAYECQTTTVSPMQRGSSAYP